jgi:K+ transporter
MNKFLILAFFTIVTASLTSSVTVNISKSFSEIVENSSESKVSLKYFIRGFQKEVPKRITGTLSIFFVCINVIISKSSSRVPKPPGK